MYPVVASSGVGVLAAGAATSGLLPATGFGLAWSIVAVATLVTSVGALLRVLPRIRVTRR